MPRRCDLLTSRLGSCWPKYAHSEATRATIGRAQAGAARLEDGLVRRLAAFESRKQIRPGASETAASLLVGLAHNSGLPGASRSAAHRAAELEAMAALVCSGIVPEQSQRSRRR